MKLREAKERYLFTTRIELPHEEDEEIDFIVLREPNTDEMKNISGVEDKNLILNKLELLFPDCLLDHSFRNEEGEKSNNKDVYRMLHGSSSLFMDIIKSWLETIPFHSRLKKPQK